MSFATDAPKEIIDALGGNPPTHQQWNAISAPLAPAVLIAGAGAGKTAVMAARIVYLVVNDLAKPSAILGLTFTNKAAANLLERVRRALAPLGLPDGEEPAISTYHAFAASLIADYGLRAGVESRASLMSEAQAWQLCNELFTRRTYDHLVVRSLYHVGSVRHLANECGDHLVDPLDVIAHDQRLLAQIAESGQKHARDVVETAHERIEMAQVVRDYQAVKRERHLLDYGDQIALACDLAADPAVAADFRARFTVALLDEYQDTNHAQAVMLERLMPKGFPVMAVGDPDQNIYAWRGASLRNLLFFPQQFPLVDDSASAQLPLVINFRSGSRILDLANHIIEKVPAQYRPSDKVLEPFEENGVGDVAVLLTTDQVAEAERIVDEIIRAHEAGTPWGEVAVLCRKKRLFSEIVEVMRRREVPLEVIGLGGLLRTPEVIDLVSVLRVLNDPLENIAVARLLRGPRWRIGHRDLARIARYAAERNRTLSEQLAHEYEGPGDIAVSLAEALADIEQIEGVSDEARARIIGFNAALAELRGDIAVPLPELAHRALDWLGLVRELEASPSPAAGSAKRNLANFLDRVAAFSPLDGEPTLGACIEWLDAFEESAEEIEASQPSDDDSVKLMTIHQAKGLEFDLVFVPGLAAGKGNACIFPDTGRQPNPATAPRYLPFELRGDREVLPRYQGVVKSFKEDLKLRALEEERRLLYVAITRARKRLVCSAAWWYYPSGWAEALKTPMGPGEFWREIRAFDGVEVIEEVELPEENPLIGRRAERAHLWPPPARRAADPLFPDGVAAAVAGARATTPVDDTLFPLEAAQPGPPVPARLPVSAIVTYATCPKRFFWSYVRPLPRRPSAAARIGTIVHGFIEQHGKGQIALYDADEFDDAPPSEERSRIAELKEQYRASRFPSMTLVAAERPFTLVVGDAVIQGRIDAIFEREGGGWEIVDFKTGRQREAGGPERWQLDLYALAAQEVWGRAAGEITITFAYIGDATETRYPARAADEIRADCGGILDAITAGRFDPSPSAGCRFCDFVRDCPEGRAFSESP